MSDFIIACPSSVCASLWFNTNHTQSHQSLQERNREERDVLTERKLHVERILRRSSYGWIQPRRYQNGVRIPCHRPRLKEDGNYSGHTFPLAVFFRFPGSPSPFDFLCCTESEDSIDFPSEFREFNPFNSLCLTHSFVFCSM